MKTIDPISIEKLFHLAADHLAGRPVLLRWQKPYIAEFLGLFHKTKGGQPVIDITPGLGGEKSLEILLHECAHVRLHYQQTESSPVITRKANSVRLGNRLAETRNDPAESEAEQLAKKWAAFARRNSWRFDGPEYARQLQALSIIEQRSKKEN